MSKAHFLMAFPTHPAISPIPHKKGPGIIRSLLSIIDLFITHSNTHYPHCHMATFPI